MGVLDSARRRLAQPAWATATVALVLRTALVLHARATNPFVQTPILDGDYYLRWARDIAGGDVLGRGGLIAGDVWFLNPLYAYAIAPIVAAVRDDVLWVVLAQAALGAATAGLAAAAATRSFGRREGWIAGFLVAFSAPLAQLDAHVAATELAAFLVAGACFACAPRADGDRGSAHGPFAAGLWLGVGALARPVTPLALPLIAWRFARESRRRFLTAGLVVAAFVACAVPSLARNWTVTGQPTLYTVTSGINAHLGSNPDARTFRTMESPYLRFRTDQMLGDARAHVRAAIGREPSDREMSSWFWRATWDDVAAHPGAAALHYVNKARWFFSAVEVPSSASLAVDRAFSPGLAVAWVSTAWLAAFAMAGAWAHRRRADVLLGPGALVLAHWAVLTLVFPLSHYRAPAIPAMAILAAGAIGAIVDTWKARREDSGAMRRAAGVALVAASFGALGAIPPGPDPLTTRDAIVMAGNALETGRLDDAERHAREAIRTHRRAEGEPPGNWLTWQLLGDVLARQGRWAEARDALDQAVAGNPRDATAQVLRSLARESLGDLSGAEADLRDALTRVPEDADAHLRLARVLVRAGRLDEARTTLRRAMELGASPDADLLRHLGR